MQPGQRTTGRYQLIVGPWEHLNGSTVDVDPLELEWFDTWLKGEHTGMASTPTPLHYYDLGSGQFDETSTLSRSPGATPTRLYFGAGGTLSSTAPTAERTGRRHARLEPASAARAGGRSTSGRWAASRSRAPAGLPAPCANDDQPSQLGPWTTSYTTAPFTHARTSPDRSPPRSTRSSTTPETQWVAELEDVTPGRHVVPAHRGRAARLAARRRPEPVLDGRRHDRAALPPVHAGVAPAGAAGRGDPSTRSRSSRRSRRSPPATACGSRCRRPTPRT